MQGQCGWVRASVGEGIYREESFYYKTALSPGVVRFIEQHSVVQSTPTAVARSTHVSNMHLYLSMVQPPGECFSRGASDGFASILATFGNQWVIDMPQLNCHRKRHIVSPRDIVLCYVFTPATPSGKHKESAWCRVCLSVCPVCVYSHWLAREQHRHGQR